MIKVNGKEIKGAVSYEKSLIERLKKSEDYQREYLKASIEENWDMPEAILMAIREIAEARGYEALGKEAKPRFETIAQLIQALGLRFTVEPIGKTRAG